jgi:hypothetical protein
LQTPCIFHSYVESKEIEELTNNNNLSINTTSQEYITIAAKYIIERSIDIKNLIYMLENYYFIMDNMSKVLSRHESLKSILGNNNDYGGRKLKSTTIENAIETGWSAMIMSGLEKNCGIYFQQYFSTTILVIDLPSFMKISLDSQEDDVGSQDSGDEKNEISDEYMHSDVELRNIFKLDDNFDEVFLDYSEYTGKGNKKITFA